MGDEVLAHFPETRFDIEEGGKCLAFDRGTACVFHLSRVVEAGLYHISREAQKCRIVYPGPGSTRSWEHWLSPIEAELRKDRKLKSDVWNAVEPSYATMVNLLRAVSAAWRHPTLQGEAKYTVEEARDIFDATCEFMRYVATAKFS